MNLEMRMWICSTECYISMLYEKMLTVKKLNGKFLHILIWKECKIMTQKTCCSIL